MKLLPKIVGRSSAQRDADAYRDLLRYEAKMGGQLFGPVPAGHRREFFCLDRYTWIWHEEWVDHTNATRAITTRYDIRPNGILKSQGTNTYQQVRGAELRNFYNAAVMYRDAVGAQLAAAQ